MEIIVGLLLLVADSGLLILDGLLSVVLWLWNRSPED